MMTATKNIFITAIASATLLSLNAFGQTARLAQLRTPTESAYWNYALPIEVYDAIAQNRPSDMQPWLNTSVEVIAPRSSGVFSSRQAQVVIDDIFSSLSIRSYEVECERTTGDQTLTIGTLVTSGAKYRVYILTNNKRIQQIKIEEQK